MSGLWAVIIADHSIPAKPEHVTSLRFWEDEPISLYVSPCPLITYLETPVLVHSYETFLNSGRAVFGAIILCWAVFGFLHRRIFKHLSRRHWIIIDICILFILCASLVFSIFGSWCENRSVIIIRQVTLIWPTVIVSLLGLGMGVGAILTSIRSASEVPGEAGNT
ncbi:MAG: hypothetical protein ABSE06_15105 [Anaerolineaceae bacterium]